MRSLRTLRIPVVLASMVVVGPACTSPEGTIRDLGDGCMQLVPFDGTPGGITCYEPNGCIAYLSADGALNSTVCDAGGTCAETFYPDGGATTQC